MTKVNVQHAVGSMIPLPSAGSLVANIKAARTSSQIVPNGRTRGLHISPAERQRAHDGPAGHQYRTPGSVSKKATARSLANTKGAIEFDRQMCDAVKGGTDGQACTIVGMIAPPASCDLMDSVVGLDPRVSSGFEECRQLHVEYLPQIKESGVNHMVGALSVIPAKDYSDLEQAWDDVTREARRPELVGFDHYELRQLILVLVGCGL